jgi:protein tyrosine/serine phosphatase
MKTAVWLFTALLGFNVFAAQQQPVLMSPFASTVRGVTIRNTHLVGEGHSLILRGMRPLNAADVEQLTDIGVRQILIFRNNVPGESTVAEEREWLEQNPKINAVYEIPFKWKDITVFQPACEQTVQALRILKNAAFKTDAGLFFHCTVGEDRTGYLAGLYRIIFENKSAQDVFQNEMCMNGYADGGSSRRGQNVKPAHVVKDIHAAITPVFAKMVALIRAGKISADKLDESVCAQEPRVRQQTINALRCRGNAL